MAANAPADYSRTQIILHWTVAVLVILQFLFAEGIEHVWDAYEDGEAIDGGALPPAYAHVVIGVTILILALARLWLRTTRGVPSAPESQSPVLRIVASGTHWLLYALIVVLPLLGAAAWFGGIEQAADAHVALKNLLFIVVALHVLGALAEHFVFRTNVLRRMLGMRG